MTMFTATLEREEAEEFAPTDEQIAALEMFRTGQDMIIEAGAGAGKTSTLVLLANDRPDAIGQYLSFNRAIAKEAERKMPRHVSSNTIHSVALRSMPNSDQIRRRMNASHRMKGWEIAQAIGLNRNINLGGKVMKKGLLAGYAMKMVTEFCKTAETEITVRHLPYINGIDFPDPDTGHRNYHNNRELARFLLPYARRIWEDAQDPQGGLPYSHAYYLKLWELGDPQMGADFVLVDEAQDLSPVLVSIVQKQRNTQRVLVGDSAQQIYEFTGAINAMQNMPIRNRTYLTKSFRFGQAVADVANTLLAKAGAELRITGMETIESKVTTVSEPDVILTRTNAIAMGNFMRLLAEGKTAHIVGGGKEVLSFAKAAIDLRDNGWTSHHELRCFDSWEEVLEYVENDVNGEDLALSVKIIEEFGAETIIEKVGSMPSQADADVVISTAHKSKGLEWERVLLAEDFPSGDEEWGVSAGEYRLLYVAATRAKLELDTSQVKVLQRSRV